MRSLEDHEHEHDRAHDDDEHGARTRSPLHHTRRTAAAAPRSGPIQRRTSSGAASFGAGVNAGIFVQARGDLGGADVHALAQHGVASGGRSLPHASAIQASFGHHDVSGVSAHVGGAASEAASAIGATAYATGDSVAFAADPDLHLAAHEAAHVVQQRGGVRLAGGVGRAGDEYERHADAVADLVVQGKSAQSLLDQYAHRGAAGGSAVQKQDREEDVHRVVLDEPIVITHEPTDAEMCAEPDDSLHPQRAYDAMRARAADHARDIGTGVPDEALNECLAMYTAIVDGGGTGSTGVCTQTLEGDYFVDHDWKITASVERHAVADCGSARGTGTLSHAGADATRGGGHDATTSDSVTAEASVTGGGSSGVDAPSGGGPTSSRSGSGTARLGRSSESSRTHRSSSSSERHGRSTSSTVRTEAHERVYRYVVTWTIETEISRTASDLPTLYADAFRDDFEPTPWGPVQGSTPIGTRREADEHADTRRGTGRRRASGPVRLTGDSH